MKTLIATLLSLVWLAAALVPENAEAARLGSGRSVGTQRAITPPPARAVPSKAAPGNAAAAQPAAGNRWLGPLAGLAAGLGLGWLLSQGGFGAAASAMLMALLAGLAVFALMRVFARQRIQAHGQAQPVPQSAQYSGGLAREAAPGPYGSQWAGSGGVALAASAPNIPAGFNVEAFVRQAKLNFLRLQEANDRGDIQALREVATDELADTLAADVRDRGARSQRTEVAGLEATLLEVVTEGDTHWASVSFQGTVSDDTGPAAAPFHEIWHLRKPASGQSGWLLAGIQQAS